VGLNVYVVNQMAKDVRLSDSYRGVVPFLITDAIRMVLLLSFPGLSLWLVGFVH
jgi:TRAP-type C4-dicarboxylate transport system permease large subunit